MHCVVRAVDTAEVRHIAKQLHVYVLSCLQCEGMQHMAVQHLKRSGGISKENIASRLAG